jgi:small subunit ribosomal protein S16
MAVHIRLARHGSKKTPFYRIVVSDQRSPRNGRFIENIGTYNPLAGDSGFIIDRERLSYWQGQGAQPSHTLGRLLKRKPASPEASAG